MYMHVHVKQKCSMLACKHDSFGGCHLLGNTIHVKTVVVSSKYDREGDTILYSLLRLLFSWANFSFYIWFPNGLKQRQISNFVTLCFKKCNESERWETRKYDEVFKFLEIY